MLKNAIVILLLFMALSAGVSFAQEAPTPREWNIYYDYAEKSYGIDSGDKQAFERVGRQVAADFGISMEEFIAVSNKVMKYGVTPEEYKIYDDYNNAIDALGPEATDEQIHLVEAGTCRKYGITKARLFDIGVRSLSD